jgi:small subunit ribosomal protein S16
MVRIRLARMGRKRQPFYRVVAADQRAPRDGRFIEVLGTYNPMTEPATVDLRMDAIKKWQDKGAQPSDRVAKLIKQFEATNASE